MKEPLYKVIYKDIKKGIVESKYPLNSQLPTDKEFSELFGVSTITIKKAMEILKNEGFISRKPRKGSHVIRNSDSIDKHAINNKSSKPFIGLVFTNFNDNFGTKMLKHLILYGQNKVDSIIKFSNGDSKLEEKLITELIESGVEGLILFPASSKYFSSKLLELSSNNFPLVLVDRFMEKFPTCNVAIDNKAASKMLINHLIDNGHKKIGIITAITEITSNEDRVEGAIRTMLEYGLSVEQERLLTDLKSMVPGKRTKPAEDIERIKEFLNQNEDITAIFAGEYAVAILVEQAIEELGKQVYKDISIVCFDHPYIPKVNRHNLLFTHVAQDEKAIGELAFELLLRKMEEPDLIEKIIVPHKLIKGMTVKELS